MIWLIHLLHDPTAKSNRVPSIRCVVLLFPWSYTAIDDVHINVAERFFYHSYLELLCGKQRENGIKWYDSFQWNDIWAIHTRLFPTKSYTHHLMERFCARLIRSFRSAWRRHIVKRKRCQWEAQTIQLTEILSAKTHPAFLDSFIGSSASAKQNKPLNLVTTQTFGRLNGRTVQSLSANET